MKNTWVRQRRTLVTTVVASCVAIAGVLIASGPASADPSVGNIPSGPYSLTITKYENPVSGPVANDGGAQQSVSGLTPLANVDYSIAPVSGVDLTTAAGWQTSSTLHVSTTGVVTDNSGITYPTGAATVLSPTDANGVTTFTSQNPGVFVVTETSAPQGVIAVAPPFLVTLPMPKNDTWLSNVYVYPKNTVAVDPTKTINDSNAYGLGQSVNWTINETIPSFAAPATLTSFVVKDALAPQLTLVGTANVTVTLNGNAVPASDYAVAVDQNNNFTVTFTGTGISLLAATPGGLLAVGVPTTVTSVGSGTIQNTPVVSINNEDFTGTPVDSTWGAVQLKKVDMNNPSDALQGAVFQVFTSRTDAESLTNPVSVDGATNFTSGSDGLVNIAGLKAQQDGNGPDLTYYIVETTAPTGFSIAPAFSQNSGGQSVTVNPGPVGTSTNPLIVVADPQVSPLLLPLTGSTGTVVFIGGGLAVIALAIGLALIATKRKRRVALANDQSSSEV